MKNYSIINIFLLFGVFFCSIGCTKEDKSVPVLTTSSVTDIKGASAICGGIINSDGGSKVTVCGICWGTVDNPTINDSVSQDVNTLGNFTSILTGLNPLTKYYLRAYATNGSGTGYGNVISFITNNLSIGERYQGGKVAYLFIQGDPGYDAIVPHGLIAAENDQSSTAKWSCIGSLIEGADGIVIGTGNQNTIDIMNFCATPGIAARLCGDLVMDGYSDWYLPSKDELNKLYLKKNQIGGFTHSSYWSSTEYDLENAWSHSFDIGYQNITAKATNCYVRAIRSF